MILFAEFEVAVTFINAFFGAIVTVAVAYITLKMRNLEKTVDKVKETGEATAKVAEDTRALSNSALGTQLESNAMLKIRIAEIVKDAGEPIGAKALEDDAKLASSKFQEHVHKQAILDAKVDKPIDTSQLTTGKLAEIIKEVGEPITDKALEDTAKLSQDKVHDHVKSNENKPKD